MNSFSEMPVRARLYILAAACAGFLAASFTLALGLPMESQRSPTQFLAYLSAAAVSSSLKVRLPTITGTLSVNSLFLLVCIVQLQPAESMVIGIAGVLIQCLWKPASPIVPVRVLFSTAANALAIWCSCAVLNGPLLAAAHEGLRVLAIALTYFLVNTGLVALVVSLTENRRFTSIWSDCYFWSFPYYLGGGGIAWGSTVLNRYFGWQASIVLLPVVYFVYRSYKVYLRQEEEEKKHVEEMAGLHLRTIEALAMAIEAKDDTTHDHLRRVRVYAMELGRRMGLNTADLQSLRAAALLHDIGKLAVPEHIISKPGRLNPDEFEKMKIHPAVGAQILEQVQFPYPVAPIVLAHHEKWDGSGYPKGLCGEQIPLGARILSAVDALDALASDRQYRRAYPLAEAMRMIAAESGRAFDPAVIAILETCYVELEHRAVHEPRGSARLITDPAMQKGGAPAAGFEPERTPEPDSLPVTRPQSPLNVVAQARQSAQELYELTCHCASPLTLSETLAVCAVRVQQLVPYDSIAIYLKEGNVLAPGFVGGQNARLFSSLRIPIGEGLSGWVAENRMPLRNGNPSVETGYLKDGAKFSTLRSGMAIPLETSAGVAGVLTLYRQERDAFSSLEQRTLSAAAPRIALSLAAIASRRPEPALALPPAILDGVQLFHRVAQWIDTGEHPRFALVIFDLDQFTRLNQLSGRIAGDRVLTELAQGLTCLFDANETAAYLGGDEFALLLPGVSPEALTAVMDRIRIAVQAAGRQSSDAFPLSFTAGAAFYPMDSPYPESLFVHAERELFCAKRGKSGLRAAAPALLPQIAVRTLAPTTPT